MAGELGKSVAEELKPQLESDEQRKLQAEDDDTYDERVLTALDAALQAEIEGFNQTAPEADQLQVKNSGGMLKITRGEHQALGVIPKHRRLLLAEPLENEPTETFHVHGGPEQFRFSSGSAGELDQDGLLRGILRLSTGHGFRA